METYKGKDEEWWEDQGGTLLVRILDSFAGVVSVEMRGARNCNTPGERSQSAERTWAHSLTAVRGGTGGLGTVTSYSIIYDDKVCV